MSGGWDNDKSTGEEVEYGRTVVGVSAYEVSAVPHARQLLVDRTHYAIATSRRNDPLAFGTFYC